jgi:hypothetical protein
MRAILLVMLLATTASAGNDELTFGSNVRSLRSNSADAITGDALVGGGLGIGRALDLELPHHLTLWTDAGITWSGATGSMFSVIVTDLFDMTITAGTHLRYQPIHNIAVSAGVAVGAQHASLSLTDSMDHTASDTAWGGVARAAVQVDLLAVDLKRFSFGLRGEFGYLAAQGIELVPTQERTDSSDTLHIPVTEASLGHLDLSGMYANIGLVAQF